MTTEELRLPVYDLLRAPAWFFEIGNRQPAIENSP